MSTKEVLKPRAKKWDPKSVNPKALFRSPDLSLLCAEEIEGQFCGQYSAKVYY